jgi:cytidylate kinase
MEATHPDPTVIAISRQLGCGAAHIGRLVAQRLHVHYVDRVVIREAARSLGLNEAEVHDREERLSSIWERMLKVFAMGSPEAGAPGADYRVIPDEALFAAEAAIVRKMARERSCVIVGKAGAHVLAGTPGLFSVFLHAPLEQRVRRLMDVDRSADPAAARARIEASDESRERFLRSLVGACWTDARCYDLCLNTSCVDFTQARDMIVALAGGCRRTA